MDLIPLSMIRTRVFTGNSHTKEIWKVRVFHIHDANEHRLLFVGK